MTLPEDFINLVGPVMGQRLFAGLRRGLDAEPVVSIRLNAVKRPAAGLRVDGACECVEWCKDGFYLETRPNFTFDPMMHAGMYYVQEASSMFLDHVLRRCLDSRPVRMLDLCAAPGGKSTVARAVLPQGSLLVSNEPLRPRAQVLAENMQKFGHPDVIVTNSYPQDFGRSGLCFDVMLADVPCSGEGMFRKDSEAVAAWSMQAVEKCSALQRVIVAEAWPCLRPGGLLVYSTCTFNTKENEENVKFICEELGADVIDVGAEASWGITGSLLSGFDVPVYRFIPGITKGEGLFMAVMRKHGQAGSSIAGDDEETSGNVRKAGKSLLRRNKNTVKPRFDNVKPNPARWLASPEEYEVTVCGDILTAVPRSWIDTYVIAEAGLKVMTAGVPLGKIKGKDVIPAQGLALSAAFSADAFCPADLDYYGAINYLRREAVILPPQMPRGYILVRYKGMPLGFVKNIGNRANNLYPAEWKIKSTHIPEGGCCVVEPK